MEDQMGDEAVNVLAAHLQQGIEGHGHHDEILLLAPDRDETAIDAGTNNKRTASDAMLEQQGAYEEDDSRKKRKSNPPPKKLNNEQWDAMFARLVEYKRLHGDCLVPKRYAEDPKLGTWVETQRIQWKKLPRTLAEGDMEVVTPNRRLNDERLKKLQSIGFAWSAKNVRKAKPASPDEPMIARARKSNIPADPVARAAARQQENDRQWMYMYDRLVEYKNKHGDCLVPKKYPEDPKLGSWVETQRNLFNREYKHRADSGSSSNEDLPPPPAAAAAMPPTYAKSPEEWADEMEQAATSVAAAADAAMAINIAGGGVEAAAMEVVNEVTADDGGGKPAAIVDETVLPGEYMDEKVPPKRLTQERKNMLDSLGFVWSLRSKRTDDHWGDMYRQLVEYKAKHGDCLVPSRYEENVKLGKWVETQRYEFTKLQRVTGQSAEQKAESPTVEDQPPEEGKGGKKSRANPRLTDERLRRLEAIGFEWKVKNKMKRYYDRQWDGMFEKLLKFKEINGHCLVPKRYEADLKLGTWVHTQRIQYRKLLSGSAKKGAPHEVLEGEASEKSEEEKNFRLTEDRRRRLDEVGFVWSARESDKAIESVKVSRNSYDDQWDAMFERLRAYKEVHGNCLVPKRYKDDPKLGTWVDTQRVQRKKMLKHMAAVELQAEDPSATDSYVPTKAPGRLTADRMERLESIGFVWSLRDDWQKHYLELKAYKEQHGHCNVPARYAENKKLGIWVSAQRQQKKLMETATDATPIKSTPLTQDRIDLLDEIGFTWTIRSRDSLGESWNQRLLELKAYKENHGNCLVPSRYPPNPELGIWVGTQRTQYRLYRKAKDAGKSTSGSAMNEDRIVQLEELGFVWALRGGLDAVWKKRISELNGYRSAHGDTAVSSTYTGNKKLASWAAAVRAQYRLMQEGKPCTLDAEKIAELDSLQFPWEEPKAEASGEDIVDSDAVAGALAAAAEMSNEAPTELDVMLGGEQGSNEVTAEDILNVAEL